jgi:erythromycin esterase
VSARVPAAVQAWVRSQAIALRSTRPGSGWDDLEPLRDVLERARVVALGEATHGTREFFRLKQRLVEYLVSALGFNVFALEADFGAALAVDDYVQGGPGTAEQALARLDFWTWNAAELRDRARVAAPPRGRRRKRAGPVRGPARVRRSGPTACT